ncbi:NAD-dependent epimerase/dehydratase family protein [Planctomycetota bacterium]
MKTLVTGATGLVGSHVVRKLIAGGHAVRVLVRSRSKLDNLEGLEIEKAEGDVTSKESLRAAVEGCEALCHTAGVASWSPVDATRVHVVNVEGTRNALEAALEHKLRRVVVTASVAVIGGTAQPEILTEDSPWSPAAVSAAYSASKRAGLMVALQIARKGLPVVCVSPALVLGPGDIYASSSTIALAVARRRMSAYVEGGISVVDVRDVAHGHVAALERGTPGEHYLLGGENLTMTTFMARIAALAGVPLPRRVPFSLAWPVAAMADLRARFTGRRQPLSLDLLRASSLYTFVSSAKAERELGYRYRSAETSLRDTLRYFLARGRLKATTPELRRLADEDGAV